MKFRLLLALSLLGAGTIIAQTSNTKRGCGTRTPSPEWDAWFNKQVTEYEKIVSTTQARPVTLTIPVVVHVIHGGQAVGVFPNISSNQIRSQIKVLNDDFAGKGYNSYKLAATGFSAVGAADTKITFCLAQTDPNGNLLADPGIDRVNYQTNGWTNPAVPGSFNNFEALMDGTIKPNTIWDPTYYFNIWVSDVNPANYLLGYATYPGGSGLSDINSFVGNASTDGIWVWGRSFGTMGSVNTPYNYGRTAVHETGHWLGLRHIGGDANNVNGDCNATDYCNDTPPQKGGNASGAYGQNYGFPNYPLHVNTCGSAYGDMFMNFMDYCDDAALYMFSPDQNTRIQTTMANAYFRNMLSASSLTQCVGLPIVELLDGTSGCTDEALHFVDFSIGNSPTSYTWQAEPSTGVIFSPSSSDPNPAISFNTPGNYTITTIASNTIGVTSSTAGIVVSTCTSIRDQSPVSSLQLAPNPASERLAIRTSMAGQVKFTLMNSLGEIVIELNIQSDHSSTLMVNVGHLAEGIYIATVNNGSEKAVSRVVIAH